MISVAMLRGSIANAAYYLERSADCDLSRYYAGEQERPGFWCGRGATALGLEGPVVGERAAAFADLLAGRLPDGTVVSQPVLHPDPLGRVDAAVLVNELNRRAAAGGGDLIGLFGDVVLAGEAGRLVARVNSAAARPGMNEVRVDARLVADLATAAGLNPHVLYPHNRRTPNGFAKALAHADRKVDVRRSGLDVVVSAPKSVSALYALADPLTADQILLAHDRAVTEALGYLERNASHGTRGHQGDGQRAQRISTDGLVAAAFPHRTSRSDDPQLHTHLVIANLLRGQDGKWSAVDSRAMHRHARTAGCVYQAVLRAEMTRTLGVAWEPVRRGVAEIRGVPRDLCRAFSTRRRQIEDELDATGGAGRHAAQRAAYRTRPAKSHAPEASLRERWTQHARARGFDPAQVVRESLHAQEPPFLPPREIVTGQLFGPAGLTYGATSFDRRDVIQSLTEILPVGVPLSGRQLETAADEMLDCPDAIPLLRADDTDDGLYSTRELLAAEERALALSATSTLVQPLSPVVAEAFATRGRLSAEQRRLTAQLLTSPDSVDLVVGPAGSGKTALIRTVAAGWRAQNLPVVGCAVAAVTARRLQAATGIPSTSLTQFLAEVDRRDCPTGYGGGLAPRTVVVVDEASMAGTRQLTSLLDRVTAVGGKLVLVGDPAQLPEIEAGGLFAALVARALPLGLTTNQRQHSDWERDALLALREGQTRPALTAYREHHRIAVDRDASATRRRIADVYLGQLEVGSSPYDVIALASTRNDVARLNTAIRQRLREAGRLGPEVAGFDSEAGPRSFAVGDVVVVTRNDHRRALLNGTRASVTRADVEGLTLRTESNESVDVPLGWTAEHLDHGYALTVHKAQGLTTNIALIHGTDALTQQAGYVALSRGRAANHLFVSEAELAQSPFPAIGPPDAETERQRFTIDRLEKHLARGRSHRLARDQRPDFHRQWLESNRDHGRGRSR